MTPLDPLNLWEERAAWAGAHALPIFLALLVLLMFAIWTAGRALRRARAGRSPRWPDAGPSGPAWWVGGCAVVVLGGATLLGLGGHLRQGNALIRLDGAFNAALHTGLPGPALRVFGAVTQLGDTATLTVLCIGVALALVAAGRHGLALGWVVAVAGNGLLNHGLKQLFGRVRPTQAAGGVFEGGFSFPSGHSSGSLVAYGMLAYLAFRVLPRRWHLPAGITAGAVAGTVGASRCMLGVHFASDVIAGFASGAAWLTLCIMALTFVALRIEPSSHRRRLA